LQKKFTNVDGGSTSKLVFPSMKATHEPLHLD
jgi:hypothetical protein